MGLDGAYTEDAQGRPHYDWTIVDRIFDTYLERGLKPYVQIGFMPQALSQKPEPYQHHWSPQGGELSTGWAYPPSDYRKWGELVYQWVTHCAGRYGRSEVEQWYWEVWNEPNIMYWRGTAEDYHRLYDHAADAVKRALPAARVGGPEIAGTRTPQAARFLRDFIEHCLRGTNHATGKVGAPLDFLVVPRQRLAANRPRARPDGNRHPASGHRSRVRGHRRLSRAEGSSDRHRRIRPRRLRSLPGNGLSPERLSQRLALRQLYRGRLRPHPRPGREARGQPRGLAHLGIRVRGSAVFHRLPRAGHGGGSICRS